MESLKMSAIDLRLKKDLERLSDNLDRAKSLFDTANANIENTKEQAANSINTGRSTAFYKWDLYPSLYDYVCQETGEQ